jgi:carboxypeptidase T
MTQLLKLSFIAITFFTAFSSYAEVTFNDRRYFVELKAKDKFIRSKIAKHIHIDQVIDDSVYSVINEDDLNIIKKKFKHLLKQSHILKNGSKGLSFPNKNSNFHTYEALENKLTSLSNTYPKSVQKIIIGKTVEGRSISGLKISTVVKSSPDEFVPAILLVGGHHAREHLSTEVPLKIIENILEKSKTDIAIQKLINSREIYFIPMLNSDGMMYDIKWKFYKYWRKNRSVNTKTKGVDLNRNYSYQWGTGGSSSKESSDTYKGPSAFSEPETKAIRDFVEANPNIRVLLSFHTFSELILYPWGHKFSGVGGKDQQVFQKMASTMSKWNGYKPQRSSDLYIASGDTCDWAYGDHGIFCFTFELSPKSMAGGGFYPSSNILESTAQANMQPVLYLIEHSDNPYKSLK